MIDDAAALAEARAEVERLRLDLALWRETADSHLQQAFENGGAALDARAQNAKLAAELKDAWAQIEAMEAALIRLRDCDWVVTLPDRMDAVRAIARAALAQSSGGEEA